MFMLLIMIVSLSYFSSPVQLHLCVVVDFLLTTLVVLVHWHSPRTSFGLQEGVSVSLSEMKDTQQPQSLERALLLGQPQVVSFLRRPVMVTPLFLYLQSQLKLAVQEHCSTDSSAGQMGEATVTWAVEAQH